MKIRSHLLQHFDDRPEGMGVDTLVVHSMCSPETPGRELYTEQCIRVLDSFEVSAHYMISAEGEVILLVDEEKRAWHAGESRMPEELSGRMGVNDFSIGVELLGEKGRIYTDAQYLVLAELAVGILERHNLHYVLGHEHVALPLGRKTDPGPLFDWKRFKTDLKTLAGCSLKLSFPSHLLED